LLIESANKTRNQVPEKAEILGARDGIGRVGEGKSLVAGIKDTPWRVSLTDLLLIFYNYLARRQKSPEKGRSKYAKRFSKEAYANYFPQPLKDYEFSSLAVWAIVFD
jgi:hypothetical protein